MVTVLLVDDDKVDAMAIKRSLRDLKISNPIIEARNGIEASFASPERKAKLLHALESAAVPARRS